VGPYTVLKYKKYVAFRKQNAMRTVSKYKIMSFKIYVNTIHFGCKPKLIRSVIIIYIIYGKFNNSIVVIYMLHFYMISLKY